jgi:hypothetical protein
MTGNITFVDRAKMFINFASDACPVFAEFTAIQILGFALGHEPINLLQPGEVYHNSYILLKGKSTKTRKTTTQTKFKSILPEEFELPKEGSYEALAEVMSDQNTGFIWLGEFSKLLRGVKRGDYNAGYMEFWNEIHDCKRWTRKIRGKAKKGDDDSSDGHTIIDKPYLSINTTCTEESLLGSLTYEMAFGGFLARFLIVNGTPHTRPRGRLKPDYFKLNDILRHEIEFIINLDKSGCAFELSDEALDYYNNIVEKECEDHEFEKAGAFAGRYQNYVVAFADILLVSEALGVMFDEGTDPSTISKLVELVGLVKLVNEERLDGRLCDHLVVTKALNPTNPTNFPNRIIVPKKFVEEAWRIIKPCLVSANDLLQYIDMGKALAKVREYIKKADGKEVSLRDAMRNTNVSAKEFGEAIVTLVKRKEITSIVKTKQGKHRQYNSQWYKWNPNQSEDEGEDPSHMVI